jgi:Rps23 Pro-64 3,4-dihydroxylase Tpa1-like proline 4-hydroxylase
MARQLSSEEIAQFQDQFAQTGVITISNFLKEETAQALEKFGLQGIPADWWALSAFPNLPGQSTTISVTTATEQIRKETWANVTTRIRMPQYLGYRFYRTMDHVATCNCEICKLQAILVNEEVLPLMENLTKLELKQIHAAFLSKYTEGCFLATHTDQGNGKVAFVYNLTRDWHPMMGACLHFLDTESRAVKQVITPQFNALTLFRVPEGGIPHYVSAVPEGVDRARLAYSGWFR